MHRFQKYLSFIQHFVHDSNAKRFLQIILFIAISSRIAAILIFGNLKNPYLYENGVIARNLVAGYGYSMYYPPLESNNSEASDYHFTIAPPPTAFTLPGIVIVYYAVLLLFGESFFSTLLFYLLNLFAAVISLVGLYYLVRMVFNENIARWSLLIASVYPVFIFAVTTFGGTVYYHAVSVIGLICLYSLLRKQTIISAIIAGIAFAIWIYFRSEMLFISPLLALYIWKQSKFSLATIYLMIIVLSALPWTLRNYYTYNAIIPLTSNGWLNFWRGNNLASNGGSWNRRGDGNWYDQVILQKMKDVLQTDRMEIEISYVYRDAALEYLKEHPLHAAFLFMKKYFMFWTTDYYDPRAKNIVYIISYGFLLLTFIAGFISLHKARQIPVPLLICIGTYSVLVSLLHVEIRYQTYVSLLYIPFAAYFLSHFFSSTFTQHQEQ